MTHAAERARDAAGRASDRLDDASDDIEATRTLGEMLAILPKHGFDTRVKALRSIRDKYLALTSAAAKRRKET